MPLYRELASSLGNVSMSYVDNREVNEPRREKTGFLHMRKQRCRSALG